MSRSHSDSYIGEAELKWYESVCTEAKFALAYCAHRAPTRAEYFAALKRETPTDESRLQRALSLLYANKRI